MPRELLGSVFLVIALLIALRVVSEWIGLGRCEDCNRRCPAWDAYCWEHRP